MEYVMGSEIDQIKATISGLEAQRTLLGDAMVNAALAPLRAKLATLATFATEPQQTPSQVLRQTTVMFADVVGSTAMSESLDAEDLSKIMDGALQRFAGIIEAQRGKVLKYMGDGMLACFGMDEVREDDAERAIVAGLAMIADAQRYAVDVAKRFKVQGFNIRVGIHTGLTLLGGGVDSDANIRGMAVNVAARMEQTAPPGGMRVSEDTYSLVQDLFEVEVQSPITVKGVSEPVTTYLVKGVRKRGKELLRRGIAGLRTRMIGRDDELEEMEVALQQVTETRRMAAVTIVADAGLGKSRLLDEFLTSASGKLAGCRVFLGQTQPTMLDQPYGLLREMLSNWLAPDADDTETPPVEILERSVAQELGVVPSAESARSGAHLIAHLIGFDCSESPVIAGIKEDSKQIRNRAFHALSEIIRSIQEREQGSILWVVDGLQWADDPSLDFMNYLAQVCPDVPILFLTSTRPGLFDRRTDWSSTEAVLRRLDLTPLDRRFSRLLAQELLQKLDDIPVALRDLVTADAEGNPYYMEELVKMLISAGAIERATEPWVVNQNKLASTRVPQSLVGILQSRIDRLNPNEKLALQQAAVLGMVFWERALEALNPQGARALQALVNSELALPVSASAVIGEREFTFRNQLLHQVTYETVLKSVQREYHEHAARWLSNTTGSRLNDYLSVIAEHFAKAGCTLEAAEYFARAAEHAASRYALESVFNSVNQGMRSLAELTPEVAAPLRWRFLSVRERILSKQGRSDEQLEDINALLEVAALLDDRALEADATWRRADHAFRSGRWQELCQAAERAMHLAATEGNESIRLLSQQRLAAGLWMLGECDRSHKLIDASIAEARANGLEFEEAVALSFKGYVENDLEHIEAYLEISHRTAEISRRLGNRSSESVAIGNVGNAWRQLGSYERATEALKEQMKIEKDTGSRVMLPAGYSNLAQVALAQGQETLALGHSRMSVTVAQEIKSPKALTSAWYATGIAEGALGRYDAAAKAFRTSIALAEQIGSARLLDSQAGLVRVGLASNDPSLIDEPLQALLMHWETHHSFDGTEAPRWILLTCVQALERAGDPRGRVLLARGYEELQTAAARLELDENRQSFLQNVPEHRQIVALWQAMNVSN